MASAKQDEAKNHKYDGNVQLNYEISEKFYEWCEFNTTHGIPNLARNKSIPIRLLWICALLGCGSYCFYSILISIMSFLSYDVLVSIKMVASTPIDFPAVTVCNLNPLDRRYSQSYIDSVLSANNISYVSNYSLIDINPNRVKFLIKSAMAGSNLTKEQKRRFGFEIDFMLLTCYYNKLPCNASDFVYMYDFDYGNCFTFNSGRDSNGNKVNIRKMNEAGSDQSFKLELYLGDEFTQGQYMYNSGAIVTIHNQSVYPLISMEGKDLATNYETDIGFTKTFTNKLSTPYSDCVRDIFSANEYKSSFFQGMFQVLNLSSYRQKHCKKLCIQSFVLKACNCSVDASLPNIYTKASICDTLPKIGCLDQARIAYTSSNDKCMDEALNVPQCPLECESVEYVQQYTRSRYPSVYYTNYLRYMTNLVSRYPPGTVDNDNLIQKNIVLLNVFYNNMESTFVNEVAKVSPDMLFGDIGGNLGLFVGMSILSFFEFIEIFIEILLIRISFSSNAHKKLNANANNVEIAKY